MKLEKIYSFCTVPGLGSLARRRPGMAMWDSGTKPPFGFLIKSEIPCLFLVLLFLFLFSSFAFLRPSIPAGWPVTARCCSAYELGENDNIYQH